MIPPTAPIVLFEQQSYQGVYGSLGELLGHVEAIDVRNDEFTVIDALGRDVRLSADSDDGPVTATLLVRDGRPNQLRERLADLVRSFGPGRFGLIDADVDLDPLLRAVWRWEHPKRPYPSAGQRPAGAR